jgi:hypothetical protein
MIRVTTLIDFSAYFAIEKKPFECGLAKHLPLISITFSKNCYNKSAFLCHFLYAQQLQLEPYE